MKTASALTVIIILIAAGSQTALAGYGDFFLADDGDWGVDTNWTIGGVNRVPGSGGNTGDSPCIYGNADYDMIARVTDDQSANVFGGLDILGSSTLEIQAAGVLQNSNIHMGRVPAIHMTQYGIDGDLDIAGTLTTGTAGGAREHLAGSGL
jgi:hypothetical protein